MIKYTFKNRENYQVLQAYHDLGLISGQYFKNCGEYKRQKLWNGFGALGSSLNRAIPDTFYGLDLSIISADHDVAYFKGGNKQAKEKADKRLYSNGCHLIDTQGSWWLRFLRKRRLKKYYLAVKYLGDGAFNFGGSDE